MSKDPQADTAHPNGSDANNVASVDRNLRMLPSVDKLLAHPELAALSSEMPHSLVVDAARAELSEVRTLIRQGMQDAPNANALARAAALRARLIATPSLRPVINATGVIIHTNLGRAPLSTEAVEAVRQAAAYSNLEFDLTEGRRGSRYVHAAQILSRVAGCEDALVVNNNAAALVIVLGAFAQGREVLLSRSQSVEIGGGFRIPDVMRQSGAKLVEVGTTNRTYVRDYTEAVTPDTSILMRVHASNFKIMGFTSNPTLEELAEAAHAHGLLLVDDIGSGALLNTERYGLAAEPTVQGSLAAGADLVLFSGDKLLGGPQCGIICGKREAIEKLRKHPLARALRVDKMTLAALEATLLHYLRGEAESKVPVWRMISATPEELGEKAQSWADRLATAGVGASVVEGESAIGGGSLPGETLPTRLVRIESAEGDEAGALAAKLRALPMPIIGRVEEGALLLDPRTVQPEQEEALLQGLLEVYARP